MATQTVGRQESADGVVKRLIKCVKNLTAFEDLPFPSLFVSKDGHSQVTLIEMNVRMNDFHDAGTCVNKLRAAVLIGRDAEAIEAAGGGLGSSLWR